jgi:hypothetical protein
MYIHTYIHTGGEQPGRLVLLVRAEEGQEGR